MGPDPLEERIAEWRAYVTRAAGVAAGDADELEDHLRDEIAALGDAGLASDEAFLIAVRRLGAVDGLSREFARENSGRLWKQLIAREEDGATQLEGWRTALALAVLAAVAVQVARVAAGWPDEEQSWLARNASLLVLPFLAAHLGLSRGLDARRLAIAAAPLALAAVVVNVFPYERDSDTEALVALHLPALLWLVLAYPYASGEPGSHERRMDFVRFTGEWLIYYALIALGGGVLTGLTAVILEPAGLDPDDWVPWVVPSGAAGAVVVAAWLVEAKQRVIENMAPVLTMLFTPLFAAMLAVSVVAYAATLADGTFDRDLLGVLDVLLLAVLGLVVFAMSAREPAARPGWQDVLGLVAVVCALALDAMVLATMLERIGDLGFTPNRTAALGLNLVLLVNLAGAAWLAWRFVTGRGTLHRQERWQTGYLPAFALWAAVVVVAFPPLFGFA